MTCWSGEPLDVGTVEQLLIDDHVVEDAWDVRRRVCMPLRDPGGPVLRADKPWEANICPWRVLLDPRDGRYHMYYQAINAESWNFLFNPDPGSQWHKKKHGSPYVTCYAHSDDGFNWTKPELNAVPWRDHARTNIVADGHLKSQAADVALVPGATDEQRRLVMIYRDIDPETGEQCRFRAWSADGVQWTPDPQNPIVRGAGDGADVLVHDPLTARWHYYVRPAVLPFDGAAALDPPIGNLKRRMCVSTSEDLDTWTFPRTVIYPDELDLNPMCLDQWTVFRHGSHFIALLSMMDVDNEATNVTHIASSADGFHWVRLPERPVFMQRGPEGAFDAGQIMLMGAPIEMGDRWHLYYAGTARGQHHSFHNTGGVGIAILPRGRLVGRFAGDRDGFLLTREVRIGGRFLEINCEAHHGDGIAGAPRFVRVGLARRATDANDHRDLGYHEGHAIEDADPISGTHVARRVSWKGRADLGSLVGQTAYLRFHMRNAGVYSFRFVKKGEEPGSGVRGRSRS
ncbi:MAG: hypothetical protein CMJ18_17260 [Phycisphaeraceae bacterium]|nr:hypothetical protein [Phycisphaeraceae bacterium]